MEEQNTTLLENLKQLGNADGTLARIAAEKKKFDIQLKEKAATVQKLKNDALIKEKAAADKRAAYAKEERHLRDEQSKLTDRRHALSSFSNYKLQQAAEKEIANAGRELNAREESMIAMLDEITRLETLATQSAEKAKSESEALAQLEAEVVETLKSFEERIQRHQAERDRIAPLIDPLHLKNYEKIRSKHPGDPLVGAKNGSCTACFMSISPQFAVNLIKGDALVRCAGCGRGLFLVVE